jgi:putative transposase
MARAPRLALAGELHYLIQRGHNRQAVFADDADRAAYLAMLRDAASQYCVAIHAYALLDCEVHLAATPPEPEALSRLMQSLGRRYVAGHNRRHGRSGTLWSGRFRTAPVDGAALGQALLAHIESQPVLAGLSPAAAEWPWSSARHHLGHLRDPLISEHAAYWALGNTPFERELAHADHLRDGVTAALHEGLTAAAMRGRAFGPASFSARVATQSGCGKSARPRGRPSGTSSASK